MTRGKGEGGASKWHLVWESLGARGTKLGSAVPKPRQSAYTFSQSSSKSFFTVCILLDKPVRKRLICWE